MIIEQGLFSRKSVWIISLELNSIRGYGLLYGKV